MPHLEELHLLNYGVIALNKLANLGICIGSIHAEIIAIKISSFNTQLGSRQYITPHLFTSMFESCKKVATLILENCLSVEWPENLSLIHI